MRTVKDKLYEYMLKKTKSTKRDFNNLPTFTTEYLAEQLNMQRSNLSSKLNELVREGKIEKIYGRPVYYQVRGVKEDYEIKKTCFDKLIGSQGSLEGAIQLAKAILLYPEKNMHAMIVGETGTGRSTFVNIMHEFMIEQGLYDVNMPFIKVSCSHYQENLSLIEEKLLGNSQSGVIGAIDQAKHGILFLENLEQLPVSMCEVLLNYIDSKYFIENKIILVCTMNDAINKGILASLLARLSIRIDLPPLHVRSLQERFEFVQLFLNEEQSKIGKPLKIDSELLHCLLLYSSKENIKQLQADIRLGCAKAYVREFHSDTEFLYLYLKDFPEYIKSGLLHYKKHVHKLENIIPKDYSFVFNGDRYVKEKIFSNIGNELEPIYNIITKKISQFEERGISGDELSQLILAEIESRINDLHYQAKTSSLNRLNLSKIVKPIIITLVDKFLHEAGERFKRVYSESLYYGLCLHLSALLERESSSQRFSTDQIKVIFEKYKNEYLYTLTFVEELESIFNITIPIDEVIFLTLFLSGASDVTREESPPVILIAMHGDTTATSLANLVKVMAQNDHVHAFDMPLDMEIDAAFDLLYQEILEIDKGTGILMIYDMGSFKSLAEMVMKRSGIYIKLLELPYTIVAIDSARKALSLPSPDEIHDSVIKSFQKHYEKLSEDYKRELKPKIIITLCMSGQGGAVQMKNYIEKYAGVHDVDIVPLAISDKSQFVHEVNQLRKEHNILNVIGTYNPGLFDIPYISISQLFETPTDKIDILLSLGAEEQPTQKEVSYLDVIESVSEQLDKVDVRLLKRYLPSALRKIKKNAKKLTTDQELGLCLHLISSIDHIKSGGKVKVNSQKEVILSKNETLAIKLKECLEELESEFYIEFDDNEIATLISIIQQK